MKKFFCILLACALMAVLLTACGENSKPAADAATAAEEAATTAGTEEKTDVAGEAPAEETADEAQDAPAEEAADDQGLQ